MNPKMQQSINKLNLLGIEVKGFNDWGIVIEDKDGFTVLNIENNSSNKITHITNMKPNIQKHFIIIYYETFYKQGYKMLDKAAVFTRYSTKDALSRNSAFCRIIKNRNESYEIMQIRSPNSLGITLLNYRGKKLKIQDTSLCEYGKARLVRWKDGKYYYLDSFGSSKLEKYSGLAISEMDADLNYIKPVNRILVDIQY